MGIAPEHYLPYGHAQVPPMATWGEGYNVNHVSLVHHEDGNVTRYNPKVHFENVARIHRKIEDNVDTIARLETRDLEGCRHVLICYGSVSRTGIEAVLEARAERGIPIGFIRLHTLWPFPERQLRDLLPDVDVVFVPEMNLGMMAHPIMEALRDRCRRVVSIPSLGSLHSPEMILARIYEELQ
jgi:2-oxoglutarate ferredoxin oxidoreductase subunit alpha